MAGAPTYQELNRQKAEADALANKEQQRLTAVDEANAMATPNPVLAEYMTGQQGLVPKDPISEYTMLATNVANAVPNQQSYSMAMVDAVAKGEVAPDMVLADDSVLPEFKQGLMQATKSPRGLR